MPNILISNVYSDTNRGGALLTLASVLACERAFPGSEITLVPISPRPSPSDHALALSKSSATLLDEALIRFAEKRRVRNALTIANVSATLRFGAPLLAPARGPGYRALLAADLVMGKGGQMFRNYPGRGQLRSFLSSASPIILASSLDIPTVLYGVQIGPYTDRRSERAAARVLQATSLVLARDAVSIEIAQRLGAPNAMMIPDTVFSIDPNQVSDAVSPIRENGYDVLIATRGLLRALKKRGQLAELVGVFDRRIRKGVASRLVVNAQSGTDGGADLSALAEFARLMEGPVTVIDELLPVGALLALYREAITTVSGRVHGGIMSVLVGTPTVVLDTSTTKATDLFKSLSLDIHTLVIEEDLGHTLAERLQAFSYDRDSLSTSLSRRVDQLRAEVLSADNAIRDVLARSRP